MSDKVFCIVVTYNAGAWLAKCLGSLFSSTVECRVVVVDNNSSDDTVRVIRANYPQVSLIRNKENLGFGKANNIGIQCAYKNGAEYFFLLNQDAWVEPDSIEKLVKIHKKYPDFGILSPVHYYGQTTLDKKFRSYLKGSEDKILNPSDLLPEPVAVKFVNAAIWLVSKGCIEKIGLFTPVLHHYAEDLNFAHRCKFHHIKIGVCPAAKAYHERGQEAPNEKFVPLKKMLARDESYCFGILLNINHYFIRQIFFLVFNTTKEFLISFFLFRLKRVALLLARIRFAARLPDLVWHRRKMKQPGYSFIRK